MAACGGMTLRVEAILAACCICLAPVAAWADPDAINAGRELAANGNTKGVAACGACHGANGEGRAAGAIPRLAGLNAGYLRAQLAAFASGTRDNATMTPMAKAMDLATMDEAAAYYASLPLPAVTSVLPTPDVKLGETIALRGDWSRMIPRCASCHGGQGLGVGAAFPAIAGQSANYVAAQLQAWQGGTRRDDPMALMKTIAVRLDPAQIAAVSAYYQTLPAAGAAMQADTRRTK